MKRCSMLCVAVATVVGAAALIEAAPPKLNTREVSKAAAEKLAKAPLPAGVAAIQEGAVIGGVQAVRPSLDAMLCREQVGQLCYMARHAYTDCIGPDSNGEYQQGTPIYNYVHLPEIEKLRYCGSLTGDQCADKLSQEQQAYCRDHTKEFFDRCTTRRDQCAKCIQNDEQMAKLEEERAPLHCPVP